MKTIRKLFICLFVICLLAASLAMPCAAQEQNIADIAVKNTRRQPINLTVYLCKVADMEDGVYALTETFAGKLPMTVDELVNNPNEETAALVMACAEQYRIPAVSMRPDEEGVARFTTAEEGAWLVYSAKDNVYAFEPFLIFLPYAENWKWRRDLLAEPHLNINMAGITFIDVSKVWDDKDDAAKERPEKVFVDLKQDEEVIRTIELTPENGWSGTFTNLEGGGVYSVEEQKVMAYTLKYEGDPAVGYVITSVYTADGLPTVGQNWWPVLCVILGGIALLTVGILKMRGKRYEEDQK